MQAIQVTSNDRGHRQQTRHLAVAPDRTVELLPYVPMSRALHLVDLENLMGGPADDPHLIALTVLEYTDTAGYQTGDFLTVAVNPGLFTAVYGILPGARLVTRGGPDGADLALLDEANDCRWLAERFHRIVIGSGDGIFARLASQLTELGVHVGVVCRPDALSYKLGTAATTIHYVSAGTSLGVSA